MTTDRVTDLIAQHLRVLVGEIGARPPGSEANRRATDYLATVLGEARLDVVSLPFRCRTWTPGDGALEIEGERFAVAPDPFSAPCDVRGRVVRITADGEEPQIAVPAGSVVVVQGALTSDTIFPKHFPFVSFPEHQRLVAFLEAQRPAAVVAVAPTEAPFVPVFEDDDLAFPSATVPPSVGGRLREGDDVALQLGGGVVAGDGVNVSARCGGEGPRWVLSAHVDSKATTPGAFDNAGSVGALLALAQTRGHALGAVEFVFFNGEDHYAAPGQQAWLAANDLAEVHANVNVDGAGFVGRRSSAAALSCPPRMERALAQAVAARPGWTLTEPWFESDHAVFAMQGIPSVAITSEHVHDLLRAVAHTPTDTLDRVDPAVLADVAAFVGDWVAGP